MRKDYDFAILNNYKYPNLVAEYMETGYHIGTLAEHMELGRGNEANEVAREKICGEKEISTEEGFRLSRLFGCDLCYLFSHKLQMCGDVPVAYIRHYDSNKRMREELERNKLIDEVQEELKNKLHLLNFMKSAIKWSDEQIKIAIELLAQRGIA